MEVQESSSNPSLDTAPSKKHLVRQSYSRNTYSRKLHLDPVVATDSSSSNPSSLSSSPTSRIFDDSPVKSFHGPSHSIINDLLDAEQTGPDTNYNTDVSPEQYDTPKFQSKSTRNPNVNNQFKLPEIGKARAIFLESDQESNLNDQDQDEDDDDAIIARIRAQYKGDDVSDSAKNINKSTATSSDSAKNIDKSIATSSSSSPSSSQSDPFTDSLSSAPPSSLPNLHPNSAAYLSSQNESSDVPIRVRGKGVIASSQSHEEDPQLGREREHEAIRGGGSSDNLAADISADTTLRAPRSSSTLGPEDEPEKHSVSHRRLQRRDSDPSDDDDEHQDLVPRSSLAARRRGAKAAAMKAKNGLKPVLLNSEPESDPSSSYQSKPRTFKLLSSSSGAEASVEQNDDIDTGMTSQQQSKQGTQNSSFISRKNKMEALAAAKAKDRLRIMEEEQEGQDEQETLQEVLGAASRSSSVSNDDQDNQLHHSEKVVRSRPSLEFYHDDNDSDAGDDQVPSGRRKKRGNTSRKDEAPKVKPLNKKQIELMNRETARFQREHRVKLATGPKRQFNITDLLSKISANQVVQNPRFLSQNNGSPSNPSQHTSDPIESDPIRDRSSPALASSPLVITSANKRNAELTKRTGIDALQLKQTSIPSLSSKTSAEGQHDDEHDTDEEELTTVQDLFAEVKAREEEKAKLDKLREIKLRALQKKATGAAHASQGSQLALLAEQGDDEDKKGKGQQIQGRNEEKAKSHDDSDDDFIIDVRPLRTKLPSASATLNKSQTTPLRHRPADAIFRQVNLHPGKSSLRSVAVTAPTQSVGTQHDPNSDILDNSSNNHMDDDILTGSQMMEASKAFGLAADVASGKFHSPAPGHRSHPESSGKGTGLITPGQLNATLLRNVQKQNIRVRAKKEAQAKKAGISKSNIRQEDDVERLDNTANNDIQTLLERAQRAQQMETNGGGDDDQVQDDPDYIMPLADDVDDAIGIGSGSENDEPLLLGSGSEAENDTEDSDQEEVADARVENLAAMKNKKSGIVAEDSDTGSSKEEEGGQEDSEKENAPPSARSSRVVMDADEDEAPGPRTTSRRKRAFAIGDDEEEDKEGEDDAIFQSRVQGELRPGPYNSSANASPIRAAQSSQDRVVLGDLSSGSLIPKSGSQLPGQRDPALLASNLDESFRTDDISDGEGLTQFFKPTLVPPPLQHHQHQQDSQPHSFEMPQKSFWDMTQTQTEITDGATSASPKPIWSQDGRNQTNTATSAPAPAPARTAAVAVAASGIGSRHVGMERDESVDSALGAFFEPTQSQVCNESLDIFANKNKANGLAKGFTQFFDDSTPPPKASSSSVPGQSHGESPTSQRQGQRQRQGAHQWDADKLSMPPPKSTAGFLDGFAALRKAQMGESLDLLDPTPSVLPSLDESQAERELEADMQQAGYYDERDDVDLEQGPDAASKKMYLNKEGFYTQTKPSQHQESLWTLDSQLTTAAGDSQVMLSPFAAMMRTPFKASSGSGTGRENSAADKIKNDGAKTPISPLASGRKANAALGDGERGVEQHPTLFDEPSTPTRKLKRLRRGGSPHEVSHSDSENQPPTRKRRSEDPEEVEDEEEEEEDEEAEPPLAQRQVVPLNVFDAMRENATRLSHVADTTKFKSKRLRSDFIEGEAEESDSEDEDDGARGGGGLKGIFDDDGKKDKDKKGKGGEEEEEDEDDGADLEGLVNDEREADEEDKNVLALARYQQDREEDERKQLEVAKKATEGVFRRGRRGDRHGHHGGLEGMLDDDADEDDLRRRALAPRAAMLKRRIEGEDGMDELAKNEESRAFVEEYQATHKTDHDEDNYDFLAPVQEDSDSETERLGEREDGDGDSDGHDDDDDRDGEEKEDEEDLENYLTRQSDDEDQVKRPSIRPDRISTHQIRQKIRERRLNKKRGIRAFDEDDEEEENQPNRWDEDGIDSDEETNRLDPRRIQSIIRDRTKQLPNDNGGPPFKKRKTLEATDSHRLNSNNNTTYGRNDKPLTTSSLFDGRSKGNGNLLAPPPPPPPDLDLDEEDDEEELGIYSILERKPIQRTPNKNITEPDEPDWGNDSSLFSIPSSVRQSSSSSSRNLVSNASILPRTTTTTVDSKKSLLLSKDRFMSRRSQFSQSK